MTLPDRNRRLLVVDDNPAIHNDIRKVLVGGLAAQDQLSIDDELLFGDLEDGVLEPIHNYDITSVYQGYDAVQQVMQAYEAGRPFSVAIVDMRMPPGWDGLETVQRIWGIDPRILVVFCTAYSDYSWRDLQRYLGRTDRYVILKKPFDACEMNQLVAAMVELWTAHRLSEINFEELNHLLRQNRKLSKQLTDLTARLEVLEPVSKAQLALARN